MTDDRTRALDLVLRAVRPLHDHVDALRRFPHDADEPLLELTPQIALDVLDRHADGELTDRELEVWAEALELRDDIALPIAFEDALRQFLFELSSVALTGEPLPVLAQRWRATLAELA